MQPISQLAEELTSIWPAQPQTSAALHPVDRIYFQASTQHTRFSSHRFPGQHTGTNVTSSNMSTLFFFVVSHIGVSHGALVEDWRPPLDNLTALQETIAPPWVSSPRTRGTFEILYSCSFTLALCVYTAIHLNVPPPKENVPPLKEDKLSFYLRKAKWLVIALFRPDLNVPPPKENVPPPKENKLSFYLRKAKWVVIALFGPEVVLYAAWDQWHQARVFYRKYNRLMRRTSYYIPERLRYTGVRQQ